LKTKKAINLNLSEQERKTLRSKRIKLSSLINFATDELEQLLDVSKNRAREISALIEFQQIPSIGIRFAEDLIFLGYYSLNQLKTKNGAELTDIYEKKKGYKTDPCVEDQFRLVVHFSRTQDFTKNWWDFTSERKKFRASFGYPKDRPQKSWTDLLG